MATCIVSGRAQDISGTAVVGAVITARVVTPVFVTTIQVLPTVSSTTSDATGLWSLTLIQGVSAVITVDYPPNSTDSRRVLSYSIAVPAAASADFSTLATEL